MYIVVLTANEKTLRVDILYYKMGAQSIKMICLIVVTCMLTNTFETNIAHIYSSHYCAVNPTTIFCKT